MQLYIKNLYIAVVLLVTLSSCGETATSDKQPTPNQSTSKEALEIYQKMTNEICNCTSGTMKNNKPSTTLDSCSNVVITKYTNILKAAGYDPTSSIGRNKLLIEIRLYRCIELFSLIKKERGDEDANKLLFRGELVSQTKLSSGLYEIILKNNRTSETKTFFAKTPLNETRIKKYEPGYELTVEYEVTRNSKTNKDEFYLKEGGKTLSIGAVKAENQK